MIWIQNCKLNRTNRVKMNKNTCKNCSCFRNFCYFCKYKCPCKRASVQEYNWKMRFCFILETKSPNSIERMKVARHSFDIWCVWAIPDRCRRSVPFTVLKAFGDACYQVIDVTYAFFSTNQAMRYNYGKIYNYNKARKENCNGIRIEPGMSVEVIT